MAHPPLTLDILWSALMVSLKSYCLDQYEREKVSFALAMTSRFPSATGLLGTAEMAGAGVLIDVGRESIWRSPAPLVSQVDMAAASNYATQMSRCQHK